MISAARSLIQHPITLAELRHQRRAIARSRAGWVWIILAVIFLVPALIACVVTAAAVLLVPDQMPDLLLRHENWMVPIIIVNFSLYPVMNMVSLGLAASSILRERQHHTWDSLLMTGVHPRRIIFAKWWASLRSMRGDYVMVAVARLGFVAALLALYVPVLARLRGFQTENAAEFFPQIALIALLYVVVDAMLTAALGLLTVTRRGTMGVVLAAFAVGVRLALMLGGFTWMVYTLLVIVLGNVSFGLSLMLTGLLLCVLLLLLTLTIAAAFLE